MRVLVFDFLKQIERLDSYKYRQYAGIQLQWVKMSIGRSGRGNNNNNAPSFERLHSACYYCA